VAAREEGKGWRVESHVLFFKSWVLGSGLSAESWEQGQHRVWGGKKKREKEKIEKSFFVADKYLHLIFSLLYIFVVVLGARVRGARVLEAESEDLNNLCYCLHQ
jgi:hypothetical protein